MEAFIEGIGEGYLKRKANNVPQQLENLVSKQFASPTDTKAQANQASSLPPEEKNQEIAKLRKELAEAKLGKETGTASTGAPSVKSGAGRKSFVAAPKKKDVSKPKQLVAEAKPKKSGSAEPHTKAIREMKGLTPLSIDPPGSKSTGASTRDPHVSDSSPPRDRRRASISSTAHHKSPIAKGGDAKDKISSHQSFVDHEELSSLGAAQQARSHASSHRTDHNHYKAASIAPSAHGGSITSTRRGRSVGQRSEIASVSEVSSIAPSAHGRSVRRGQSVGYGSEIGSNAASVATRPPPPPAAHMQVITTEARRPDPIQSYEVEEPGLYVVEVEEDPRPIRAKSVKYRGGTVPDYAHPISRIRGREAPDYAHVISKTEDREIPDYAHPIRRENLSASARESSKRAVEVKSSQGRTLYRVS